MARPKREIPKLTIERTHSGTMALLLHVGKGKYRVLDVCHIHNRPTLRDWEAKGAVRAGKEAR